MDEYLFSSLLALWKVNQREKKRKKEKKNVFPYFASSLFSFPFHLSKAVLHIIPWLLNHDELQVHLWQEKQPSPLPFHPHYSHAGFLLNFWTESTASYVPQCTCNFARKRTKRWASRKSSYKPTPDGETEAVSQTLWYTHRCHFPGLRIIMEIFTTFR